MFKEGLIKTDLEVLQLVLYKKMNITRIATELGKSLSWTSECVSHLAEMGLIDVEKKGISKFVTLSSNSLGKNLSLLMTESTHLNLNKILTGSGLLILPLLLEPGSKPEDISVRVSRSLRTIKDALVRWNSMGVVILAKKTGLYSLNQRQNYLLQFVLAYSEFRNKSMQKELISDAIMVWQWREEFLVFIPYQIEHPQFIAAAASRLDELGYEILHTSHYYFYSPKLDKVSKEEAFVQTIKTNPENPRIFRLLREGIKDNMIKKKNIQDYAKKYGIEAIIDHKEA